jgi:flagella basal body P-ring formation protein FlgA
MRRRQDRKKGIIRMAVLLTALFLGQAVAGGTADAATIQAGDIREAVRAYIQKNMPWPEKNVRIYFSSRNGDASVPGTHVKYDVRGKRNDPFIGDCVYTVRFSENDILLREEAVRTRVEVFFDVVVSARPLEKDSMIGEEDVRFEGRWFTEMPSNVITDLQDVVGKRLIYSVRPNCEITKNMIKNSIVLRRGKLVRIIFENGPLRALTAGLSEEDGARNDVVKVRNVSSSKIIYARVLDENTVRVDY